MEFNYEKWKDKYYNKKVVNIKECLNENNIDTLKKLKVEVEDKIYTENEWEILYLAVLEYYDSTELSDEEKKMQKTLEGTGINREQYNYLLEKINNINTRYNLF